MATIGFRKFGNVIRDRRRLLELAQNQVARRINTSASYLANLEAGKRRPSVEVVTKLAEVLQLDTRELFLLTIPKLASFLSTTKTSSEVSAWNIFLKDKNLREIYNITDREMETLSKVAMMGEVRSSQDFIFILKLIRRASKK